MADQDTKPLTNRDARVAYLVAGVVIIVVGAYFRLEAKVQGMAERTAIIETRQGAQDGILHGIEKAVSRIEGRLGTGVADVPARTPK